MKVNLHMLQEDLADLNLHGHLEDDPWTMRCTHAVGFSGGSPEFREDAILVANPESLPGHVPPGCRGASIICNGKPSEEWLLAPCNLLYASAKGSMLELFNRVTEAIAGYQVWEDELIGILNTRTWAEEVGTCIHRYIKNPIVVATSGFETLVWSIPDDVAETPQLQAYREEYGSLASSVLPTDEVNLLISDEGYYGAIDSEVPSMFDGKYYGYRSLYYNIRVEGVPVGRLAIDEVVTPITDRDYALAKVLGDHFAKMIDRSKLYSFNRLEDLEPVLQGLLSHRLLPEKRIRRLLDCLGWGMDDEYACLLLRLMAPKSTDDVLEPLALGISEMFSDDCYTIFDGSIVFVCNLTKMGSTDDQMLSKMLPYLRDNLLTASLSSTYVDFKDLYYYYRQAKLAFEIGQGKDPSGWVFRFDDCYVDCLVEDELGKTVPGALVPKGLRRLMEHDERKGSGYVELLRVYLDNDRSVADVTRVMHMHRSTVLYRLQRIEELLGMDLDDPDVRLALGFALRVMDASGMVPASRDVPPVEGGDGSGAAK